MEKQLIILMGVQGSGKSTFCQRYFKDGYVRINLDMLKTTRRILKTETELPLRKDYAEMIAALLE